MANSFFYTDADGNRQGPLTPEQLQTLATNGIITPETLLKTDTGHQGKAGQIPGLQFGIAAPSPFVQTAQPTQQSVSVPEPVQSVETGINTDTASPEPSPTVWCPNDWIKILFKGEYSDEQKAKQKLLLLLWPFMFMGGIGLLGSIIGYDLYNNVTYSKGEFFVLIIFRCISAALTIGGGLGIWYYTVHKKEDALHRFSQWVAVLVGIVLVILLVALLFARLRQSFEEHKKQQETKEKFMENFNKFVDKNK